MNTPQEYREMEFIELFWALAKLYKPEMYVELGVKRGYTIRRMAPYVKQAIGVDITPLELGIENVTMIKSTTLEYAATLQGRPEFIDMLFIDADHSRQAVAADFNAYLPYVRSGTGLILMHDTHPMSEELTAPGYCGDAWMAARRLKESVSLDWEICTLPGPWAGLSIVRKLTKNHLSWM